ncbi:hypothetical protein CRENBAI_024691 [Crenichthys baileyi]|uniref:Uncharacterized protein n=1 Tax=Crenichthys baileyi TaxID=28760 RepID=A0AAV9RHI5_9TELE
MPTRVLRSPPGPGAGRHNPGAIGYPTEAHHTKTWLWSRHKLHPTKEGKGAATVPKCLRALHVALPIPARSIIPHLKPLWMCGVEYVREEGMGAKEPA